MPTKTPPLIIRLDPAYPPLWRDEHIVQFGIEDLVRIDAERPWVEPLIARLRTGIRATSFDVIAHTLGAPRRDARAVLTALRPLLRKDIPPPPALWVESLGDTDTRAESRLCAALADEGINAVPMGRPHAIAVVIVNGAAAAQQFTRFLREDIPHLPIAFESGGTTIGPVIFPGTTPCLSCRDAQKRDEDPAWPLLHAQLIGGALPPLSAVRVAEAAGLVARLLAAPGTPTRTRCVRVTPDGKRVWQTLTFHEECRCRATSFPSPPGTGKAHDLDAQKSAPTISRGFAPHA